ncbi:signal peptidase I [Luteipulveratus flavus]|uniref:signal peptidase I n=1 Tax=Luteipulveratus flavus TaxID=3031728 RepID=UPI00319E5EAC
MDRRDHDPVRDDVTRAIPRWDPARDTATVPVSREAVEALGGLRATDTAHPLPMPRSRAALDPSLVRPGAPGRAGVTAPPRGPAADPDETAEYATGRPAAYERNGAPVVRRTPTAPTTGATREEAAAEPDEEDEEQPKHGKLYSSVRELLIVAVIALTLSLVVKTFLMQPFWIPSGSMNNTLIRGDRVVVSKLTPGPFDLKRGDVVVFKDPDNWLEETPSRPGPVVRALEFVGLYPAGDNHLIKRVIGLPGDHVVCCDRQGRLTVNGVAIDEPYVFDGDAPSEARFDIRVPDGKVWVMGDHRSDSSDSRFHDDGKGETGSVPVKDITGRAVAVVWPVGRMEWLSDYPDTFDKVPTS